MACRKKFDDVNGWIVLDKPREDVHPGGGVAEAALLHRQQVRPRRHPRPSFRLGHAADRLSARRPRRCPFVMDGTKVYRFTVRWALW